jgi:branched-chain amino acid transport system substrate-binding protein
MVSTRTDEVQPTRRRFLKGAASALAIPAVLTRPGWAESAPIKIGAVDALTGPAQLYGKQNVMALRLAIDRVNKAGGLLGRQVVLVSADYEGKNDLATRRLRELLFDTKVDAVTTWGGASALVAAQLAAQQGKFFVTPQSVPIELAGQAFQPTTFMCSLSIAQIGRAMACVAAKSPLNNIYQFHPDAANGRSCAEAFRNMFNEIKRPEQKIVAEEYFPLLGVSDFSPYVTKIAATGPGLVPSIAYGGDLRNLLLQGHSLGWGQKILSFALNDPNICRAVGDGAVGHVSVQPYMLTIDNPLNAQLIKEWVAAYQVDDLYLKYPEQAGAREVYTWLWFFDAVRKAGTLEKDAVIAAFENSRFDTPWGEVSMRACDHQVIAPAYCAEVLAARDIPDSIRYFGDQFPYIGAPQAISAEQVSVPTADVNNPRCRS